MAIQGHSRCLGYMQMPMKSQNNFGPLYEISKDMATVGSKNCNFRRHRSHL